MLRNWPSIRLMTMGFVPALLYLITFFIAPLGALVMATFFERDNTGGLIANLSLEAWKALLSGRELGVISTTVADALAVTFLCVVLSYVISNAISRLSNRVRTLLLVGFLVPTMIDVLIKAFSWMNLMSPNGILDAFLSLLPYTENLLFAHSRLVLIFAFTFTYLPFMLLPVYLAFERIDKGLLLAARDVGASRLAVFLDVIVPQTRRGVLAGTLLTLLPVMSNFLYPEIIAGGTRAMIGTLIKLRFFEGRDWPGAAVMSVITLICGLLMIAVIHALVYRLLSLRWRRCW